MSSFLPVFTIVRTSPACSVEASGNIDRSIPSVECCPSDGTSTLALGEREDMNHRILDKAFAYFLEPTDRRDCWAMADKNIPVDRYLPMLTTLLVNEKRALLSLFCRWHSSVIVLKDAQVRRAHHQKYKKATRTIVSPSLGTLSFPIRNSHQGGKSEQNKKCNLLISALLKYNVKLRSEHVGLYHRKIKLFSGGEFYFFHFYRPTSLSFFFDLIKATIESKINDSLYFSSLSRGAPKNRW